jgi:hypothetical protein
MRSVRFWVFTLRKIPEERRSNDRPVREIEVIVLNPQVYITYFIARLFAMSILP